MIPDTGKSLGKRLTVILFLSVCFFMFGSIDRIFAGDPEAVRAVVDVWRQAWEDKDIDAYIACYSLNFRSGSLDYNAWRRRKTELFKRSEPISLRISEPVIEIRGENAFAVFIQTYISGGFSDEGEKRLVLVKRTGEWKIVSEEWLQSKETDRTTQVTSTQPTVADTSAIVVKDIRHKIGKSGIEMVYISLNRFCSPKTMALEGEKPRIAIDIPGVLTWKGPKTINTNGLLIKRIRTHFHADTKTLRAVLDLDPMRDYQVDPYYYESDHVFSLRVRTSSAPTVGEPDLVVDEIF